MSYDFLLSAVKAAFHAKVYLRVQAQMLTLMKGDKVVELANKRPDLFLLCNIFRYRKVYVKEIFSRNIEQAVISCALGSSLGYTLMPPICIEENGQKIRVNLLLFFRRKNDVER